MLSTWKLRIVCAFAVSLGLLLGVIDGRLAAQTAATATILGTVTDSSGGAVPGAMVQVTNTDTGISQTVTSDAQGRYRAPELPVGNYQIQTQKAGFQAVVNKGITLSVGANLVVDVVLPVGQVTQSVTVESNVTQVETTSSAIANTVDQEQMRDLPLNGRNFEELIQLAPGATVNNGAGALKNSFTGNSNYFSVSGSRSNGQGELLDGTDIQNYQDRGSGSGILGSTLGVDAISEFQVLTNTYGAQYGGNGSVVNAVTRSGTNDLHGSAYEFLRNSALDAKNFADVTRQPFKKNQFGGTLGGPIKKDKMFFFGNYEGIRQDLGLSELTTVPDSNTLEGIIPGTATGSLANCVSTPTPAGAPSGQAFVNCGPGSTNDTTLSSGPNAGRNPYSLVSPYLQLYKNATSGLAMTEILSGGSNSGTAHVTEAASEPGTENYAIGRFDWTISANDSLFVRYLFDGATLTEPFYNGGTSGGFPQYPNFDKTRNQYATIGEKHILTNTIINSLNLGYTRSFLDIHSAATLGDPLDWSGDIFTSKGEPVMDGTLSPGSSIEAIGPGQISPIRYGQNKIGISDDILWSKGAHTIEFGGSAIRIQTNGLHPFPGGGTWTFPNLSGFLTDSPTSYKGPCNYNAGAAPACVVSGTNIPLPFPSSQHDMRETDYAIYVQDGWKIRPTLTLNVGLRYAPTSNPWDAFHQIYMLLPVPYGQLAPGVPPVLGTPPPSTLTPEPNFMLRNPSLHDLDPRIGLAWDPFKDHKTSVRAGYGIFHAVTAARDYSYGAFFLLPWSVNQETQNLVFPTPFQNIPPAGGATTSATWGTNPYNTTPYLQQWNLTVQREVMKNTIVSVAYVGSHGVHLVGQADENPPVATGSETTNSLGQVIGSIALSNGQLLYPAYTGQTAGLSCLPVTGVSCTAGPDPGSILCSAPTGVSCTLATSSGAAAVDPTTKQMTYSHIVRSSTAANATYSIQSNTHINPNFSYLQAGATNDYSLYNALQASFTRRMTNNLSLQVSYTYSDCVDISSGNWSQEGGTANENAYNIFGDRGPCVFMVRHNLSTNGLYMLPFKKNRLISGWQIGGIFYASTGGPFNPVTFTNGMLDIGTAPNRPNYVPNGDASASFPACNGQPILKNPVIANRQVPYLNMNCFAEPTVGEPGNVGRDTFFAPDSFTLNTSLQKNTKINERFNLQFRWEVFNILNRSNFANPGFPAFIQGSSSSPTSVGAGSANSSTGAITTTVGYPLNGSARQMQFGLKLIF